MTLENNKYLEYAFDMEEITSFNFASVKTELSDRLADVDSYNIIIFDMTKVKYMDSTGLNFFLNIRKKTGKEMILNSVVIDTNLVFSAL